MIKIMFVCLGNICRSPMAEIIMKKCLIDSYLDGEVQAFSAATSDEERGSDIYPPAARKLKEMGYRVVPHNSTPLSKYDYDMYDMFIGMEERNVRDMLRIFGGDKRGKVKRLLDFSDNPRDIADPWWTGKFDRAFSDIKEGCECLTAYLLAHCI